MPRKVSSLTAKRKEQVCLLQHYCPFCFKGKIGVSSGLCVPKGSPLIDEVQALHAASGNGLCPLDFRHPGDFCANSELCKMVCLVCGQSTIDGSDAEFELFYNLFGGGGSDEEGGPEVTAKYEIHEAMLEYGLVWTEQWDLPIHKECSQKTVCKCVVALGTTVCPKHQRSLVPTVKAQQTSSSKRPAEPPCPVPQVVQPRDIQVAKTQRVVMEKAAWLPPPTLTTRAMGDMHGVTVSKQEVASKNLRNPVVSIGHRKNGKPAPKQTVKAAKAEAVASKCAKINTWTGTHPTNKGLVTPMLREHDQGLKRDGSFSLREHNERFDPWLHGPCRVNGVDGYRRGDGVFVPTTCGVNTLNEDGSLTPLAPR